MPYKLSVWDSLVRETIGDQFITDWNLALQCIELALERLAEIHPDYEVAYFQVAKPDGKCFTYRFVNGEWEVESAMRLGYGGATIQIYDNPNGGWIRGVFQKNTGYTYELTVDYVEPMTKATEILDIFSNLLSLPEDITDC